MQQTDEYNHAGIVYHSYLYLCSMHYASVENISKSFGIRTLFKNISINIEEGDKIALVARNGSGKSTLMKIIAGLDTADSGTVWIHKDIKAVMLQQETDFDPDKTIWDNVLRLDNAVIKLVKEYELFLETGLDDHEKLGNLMADLGTAPWSSSPHNLTQSASPAARGGLLSSTRATLIRRRRGVALRHCQG